MRNSRQIKLLFYAAVPGVTKSQTRLRNWTTESEFSTQPSIITFVISLLWSYFLWVAIYQGLANYGLRVRPDVLSVFVINVIETQPHSFSCLSLAVLVAGQQLTIKYISYLGLYRKDLLIYSDLHHWYTVVIPAQSFSGTYDHKSPYVGTKDTIPNRASRSGV